MNLTGKTRSEIVDALDGRNRAELVDLICSLAAVEELLTPAELARREKRDRRNVLRDIKSGRYGGGYYAFAFNSLRISASAVNGLRAQQFVRCNSNGEKENGRRLEPVSGKKSNRQKRRALAVAAVADLEV